MKGRIFKIAVVSAVVAALMYGLWAVREAPKKTYAPGPVVFILAGNLRPDVLGCYRSDGYTDTPNVDRLARDSIRFTNVHAAAKTLRYIDGRSTTESVFEAVAFLEGDMPVIYCAFEEAYRPFVVPEDVSSLHNPSGASPFADAKFWGTDPINYELEVRSVDRGVGELLDFMRKHGYYDKSWIVVVSDSRECFKRWHEAPMVPLLIKPPYSHEASIDTGPMHVSEVYDLLAEMGAGRIDSELEPSDWPIANAPKEVRLIGCIGDSLAAGYGSEGGGSYLDHLSSRLGNCETLNLGKEGLTTPNAVAVLAEMQMVPDVVILTLGSADVLKYVSKQGTLNGLATIIDTLQSAGAIVVYAVADPLVLRNEAWSGDIRDLCRNKGVVFVPDVMDRVWRDSHLMSTDSLHPNGDGYRIIAERIYEQLREHIRE